MKEENRMREPSTPATQAPVTQGSIAQQDQNPEAGLVEPESAMPKVTVDGLPLPLRQAVGRAGWSELMPVQSRAIPYLLAGRDLMVQSRTGSGKTAAFL